MRGAVQSIRSRNEFLEIISAIPSIRMIDTGRVQRSATGGLLLPLPKYVAISCHSCEIGQILKDSHDRNANIHQTKKPCDKHSDE
jgi:hypothetical protein